MLTPKCTASTVSSLVYRYDHTHNVQPVVSSLVYRHAHIHNVHPVQFPLWCTGILAPIMYSQYNTVSYLVFRYACTHNVQPVVSSLVYRHAHIHNVHPVQFPLWCTGMLAPTMHSQYSCLSGVQGVHTYNVTVKPVTSHLWNMGVLTLTVTPTTSSQVWYNFEVYLLFDLLTR